MPMPDMRRSCEQCRTRGPVLYLNSLHYLRVARFFMVGERKNSLCFVDIAWTYVYKP